MRQFLDHLLRKPRKEIEFLIDFLDCFHSNPTHFKQFTASLGDKDRAGMLEQGWFNPHDITAFGQFDNGLSSFSYSHEILNHGLERLNRWALITPLGVELSSISAPKWVINKKILQIWWSKSLAENIVRGMLFVLEKYALSIPSVVVRTTNGDEAIATGFLISVRQAQRDFAILITNKHVTQDGAKINNILAIDADGKPYKWSEVIESARFDLAAIVVDPPPGAPHLEPFSFTVLEDVVTVGYPKVAVAAEPTMLVHKGEINGVIKNRHDDNSYLAISCAVAPGNSGGPALNAAGQVVGVVSLSSIGRYGTSKEIVEVGVHHLAVPSQDLVTFINSEVVPRLASR